MVRLILFSLLTEGSGRLGRIMLLYTKNATGFAEDLVEGAFGLTR
jgi:hypothetical protein